jgi:gluconokinase
MLIDRSVASGSGLLGLQSSTWNADWQSYLDLEPAKLGELVEPSAKLNILPDVCRDVGLPTGTPLVIGACDGMLSSLGVGALQPGQYVAMLATSGAFRTVRPQPALHPQKKTWALYLADGLWVCGTSLSSGGIVYRWVRDTYFHSESSALMAAGADGYGVVNDAAASVPRGSGGLLMLPYLSGERSPNWNVDARGMLVGLNLSHDRRHVARAAMEGISIHFALAAAALFEVCGPPVEIRATGGFRKSDLWIQTMADALAKPLSLPPNVDASGLGAALLAMRVLGVYDSLFEAARLVPIEGTTIPDPAGVKQYANLSDLYERVYASLEPAFGDIASAADVGN